MVLLKSLVLSGLLAVASAKSAVIDLIPSNFDDIVTNSGKPALVEFFAPWCGHCKNLAPTYEELATNFESSNKVTIAKVDADAEKELGRKFGVQGFPTLKWFDGKGGAPETYNGGRDLDSLTKFIEEKSGVKSKKVAPPPSAVEYLTDSSFPQTVGGDKHVLVAFTAPWCGHCKSLAPTWEQLATDFAGEDNVVIAKVDAEAENSKALANEQGVKSYPTIKFFPAGSKEAEPYNGGRSEKDFLAFINEKAGTHRVAGGGLDATAGTIAALDSLVEKYTGGASIADVSAEITKAVKDLAGDAQYKYAEYYVRVFDKLSKSDSYVSKEIARLDGLMKKGGLAPAKLDEFTSKSNILKRFLKDITGKDEL